MKFAAEKIRDAWSESFALAILNNKETGCLDAEFDPDYPRYCLLEDAGHLILLTARADDGELIAYATYFLNKHIHYPSTLWAIQDAMFVAPKYRGITAVKFIHWMDHFLAGLGLHHVVRQVTKNNDYSRTLGRMGYETLELNYMRRL